MVLPPRCQKSHPPGVAKGSIAPCRHSVAVGHLMPVRCGGSDLSQGHPDCGTGQTFENGASPPMTRKGTKRPGLVLGFPRAGGEIITDVATKRGAVLLASQSWPGGVPRGRRCGVSVEMSTATLFAQSPCRSGQNCGLGKLFRGSKLAKHRVQKIRVLISTF